MSSSLNVVFVYAFDETQSTKARVDQVEAMVQKKLAAQFPGSCISSVSHLAFDRYSTEKKKIEVTGDDGSINNFKRSYTTKQCYENMASGLLEADKLIMIEYSLKKPRGIILLFSDVSTNMKGCFFDTAEDYVSKFPVHTFTLSLDGHNPGLCNIAANSPGGTFNSIPIPNKPDESSPLSLLLDGILSGSIKDDEKPPAGTGSNKGVASIKEVKYMKDDDAALTTDTAVTAEVEIRATSSAAAVREGLDLVAVLDVSCREDKDKIDSLKNAMKLVISKLTPMDRLSIVIFSDGAARLTPLRCMTPAAQKELFVIVNGLSESARIRGGGTNIKAGLDTGLAVIANRVHTTARTANVFLVSYGKQTVDDARVVDPGEVAAVYTFGVGGDSDHHLLLSDLAAKTKSRGGMFSAVSSDGENDLSVALSQSQLLAGLHTAVVPMEVQLTITPKTADVVDDTTSVVASGTDDYGTKSVDDNGGTGAITINLGTLFAGAGRKVVIILGGVEDGRIANP